MPATVGKLEEFDPSSDSIRAYVEREQLFIEANNVEEAKKVAVFLSAIGSKTHSLLRNLLTPTLPKDKSFDEIVEVLEKHFDPKPLDISEHFHFNQRQQAAGESVAQYVAELRRLTTHCNFSAFLTEAYLTFQRAVEIAQSMEATSTKSRQIHESMSGQTTSLQKPAEVCKVGLQSQQYKSIHSCYRCGKSNHQPVHYRPFKTTRCHYCGKHQSSV